MLINYVKETKDGKGYIVSTEDGEHNIPFTPGSFLYREVKEWLGGGNVPLPYKTSLEIEKEKQDIFRNERDANFRLVDKYQGVLIYSELNEQQRKELGDYRNKLKDATKNWIMPIKPIWIKD